MTEAQEKTWTETITGTLDADPAEFHVRLRLGRGISRHHVRLVTVLRVLRVYKNHLGMTVSDLEVAA